MLRITLLEKLKWVQHLVGKEVYHQVLAVLKKKNQTSKWTSHQSQPKASLNPDKVAPVRVEWAQGKEATGKQRLVQVDKWMMSKQVVDGRAASKCPAT